MEDQRKQFDPEKQKAVSLTIEQQKLELGNLCDGTSYRHKHYTSFLGGLYKNHMTMDTYM